MVLTCHILQKTGVVQVKSPVEHHKQAFWGQFLHLNLFFFFLTLYINDHHSKHTRTREKRFFWTQSDVTKGKGSGSGEKRSVPANLHRGSRLLTVTCSAVCFTAQLINNESRLSQMILFSFVLLLFVVLLSIFLHFRGFPLLLIQAFCFTLCKNPLWFGHRVLPIQTRNIPGFIAVSPFLFFLTNACSPTATI